MTESDPTAHLDPSNMITITPQNTGKEGVVVLAVAGELDLLTTQALEAQLTDALAPPNKVVVLDLSEVHFLGSAALSTLLSCAESAKSGGIQFRLVATERATLRPLEVTGIRSTFTIFESVDAALASVD